jgi:hypothetical protein
MSYHDNSFRIVIGTAINIPELASPNAAGARILSFMSRPKGWKYGKGVPPTPKVVGSALVIAAHLMRLEAKKTGAFLAEDGGIVVTGYFSNWTSEVLCNQDGKFELVVEAEGEEKQCEIVTDIRDAIRLLDGQVVLWGEKKSSSGSFTLTTLTSTGGNFRAGQLKDRLETVKYLSSTYSALATTAGQFAATYASNTLILPVSRQFIGGSVSTTYLPIPDSFKKLTTGMNVIISSGI